MYRKYDIEFIVTAKITQLHHSRTHEAGKKERFYGKLDALLQRNGMVNPETRFVG